MGGKARSGDQRLRHSGETKSVDRGKGGRKTLHGEGEWGSSRRASVASQALLPAETPMSALGSGDHRHSGRLGLLFRCWGGHRHHHLLGAHHFQPGAPDVATWPVSPKHWATTGGRRWCENRCRGKNLGGRDRPEHGADPSWLFRVPVFQARGAEVTGAAIPDASGIHHTRGAIALGSSFLRIERMMGGAEQLAIRLERKSRSWKTTRK